MKKFLVLAALALMTLGFATQADAARFVSKKLRWMHANSAVVGGKTFNDKDAIGGGETDTTEWFGVSDFVLPQSAFSDSVVIGWIVLGIDSTAAYAPAATTFTINIDTGGGSANDLNMGTTGAVTFTDNTTTDRLCKFPIYNNYALTRGIIGSVGNWGPKMRMRITSAAGGAWAAATLELVYLTDDPK